MLLATVLVVFVLSPLPEEPTNPAFESAVHEVLGADTTLRLESVPADLPDEEAAARAGDVDGVVQLTWSPDRRAVTLRCYLTEQRRWVSRTVAFDDQDQDTERGRLLGYAVGSMYLEFDGDAPPALAPEPVATPPPTQAPAVRDPPRAPVFESSRTLAIDWSALGVAHPTGDGYSLGGAVALRLQAWYPLFARSGVSVRLGRIPAAASETRTVVGSVGMGWAHVVLPTGPEFTVHGDLLGSWFEVSRRSALDGELERQSRWLFGADLVGTVGYRVSRDATLYVGAGVEGMFGVTEIYTAGSPAATVPALRLLGELGLRTAL